MQKEKRQLFWFETCTLLREKILSKTVNCLISVCIMQQNSKLCLLRFMEMDVMLRYSSTYLGSIPVHIAPWHLQELFTQRREEVVVVFSDLLNCNQAAFCKSSAMAAAEQSSEVTPPTKHRDAKKSNNLTVKKPCLGSMYTKLHQVQHKCTCIYPGHWKEVSHANP